MFASMKAGDRSKSEGCARLIGSNRVILPAAKRGRRIPPWDCASGWRGSCGCAQDDSLSGCQRASIFVNV
jgi:hypothetical protein